MDKITNGKRAIGQNRWGNWFGYSGGHRLFDFGTDEYDARIWLRSPEEYAALKAQSLSNAMIKRITDDGMANILAALRESRRLSELAPHALISEVLASGHSDALIVVELMNRVMPGWAEMSADYPDRVE